MEDIIQDAKVEEYFRVFENGYLMAPKGNNKFEHLVISG